MRGLKRSPSPLPYTIHKHRCRRVEAFRQALRPALRGHEGGRPPRIETPQPILQPEKKGAIPGGALYGLLDGHACLQEESQLLGHGPAMVNPWAPGVGSHGNAHTLTNRLADLGDLMFEVAQGPQDFT